MSLSEIVDLSHYYGSNPNFVLAGGGNSSYKDDRYLYIKPSGVSMASVAEEDFVRIDREAVRKCLSLFEPSNPDSLAEIKRLMNYSVCGGSGLRPSIETPLHELFDQKFVMHTHPALVNGMTCGRNGHGFCAKLFPDALWVDYCAPGIDLAVMVAKAIDGYRAEKGRCPDVIFLANHGVFVASDSTDAIKDTYNRIIDTLERFCSEQEIDFRPGAAPDGDPETVAALGPKLRAWMGEKDNPAVVTSFGYMIPPYGGLSPDHIVYMGTQMAVAESADDAQGAIERFRATYGKSPKTLVVKGKAIFCAGRNLVNALKVKAMLLDAAVVERVAEAFGGVRYLDDEQCDNIEKWEAESYRLVVSRGKARQLTGTVAVVTGGAQGFGYGIAVELAALGAEIVVADMNEQGAVAAAAKLGAGSRGFAVNVADEASVKGLVDRIVATYGGVDLLVSNAGVARAGSVKTFALKDWEFVTNINYIGFFLCSKYFASVMAVQNAETGLWTDIVQVNSKSGLVGSKNNGAYAGSKFGGIGLVQSFALELVTDKIKVNAVCPGNFLDGPLWSDPVRGLFVQYLAAGKVPGAKTVEDVRRHYESLVPMNRGCFPKDVAKAIVYAKEQQYETGQAIAVTGGQVMLS
ncbi:MAG: SDR family NAD(P)-dependent oxidoreductase [Victivallaceae bacterium]|nr:SDR family NAD(P)-dependent oxidoreductase [Victivallaceae bacterium]